MRERDDECGGRPRAAGLHGSFPPAGERPRSRLDAWRTATARESRGEARSESPAPAHREQRRPVARGRSPGLQAGTRAAARLAHVAFPGRTTVPVAVMTWARLPTVAGAAQAFGCEPVTCFPFHPADAKRAPGTTNERIDSSESPAAGVLERRRRAVPAAREAGCGDPCRSQARGGRSARETLAGSSLWRCVGHHENTFRTMPYSLTGLDFSNYSASMDAELSALEDRIRQAVELVPAAARREQRPAPARSPSSQSDNKRLAEQDHGARERLEGLLEQIPE